MRMWSACRFSRVATFPLVGEVMTLMRAEGLGDIPVMVGGIIPEEDARTLMGYGVARVYTPKDFELKQDHDGYRPRWPTRKNDRR